VARFYRGCGMREGVGFRRLERSTAGRSPVLVQVFLPEEEDGAAKWGLAVSGRGGTDGQGPGVSGCRKQRRTPSGQSGIGPGPNLKLGRIGPLRPFFLSLFLFLFLFSKFLFVS
jgi:hypothetical protein